jgi:regulator of protease activity HflC (stomatin/prohibitin superfamily)
MQGPAVKANPAADQKDTYDRVMRGEARKRAAAPRSRGNVERETGDKMRGIIEEQAAKERMDTYPVGSGLKKGGKVKGMHRMPDGKMMKDSAHKKQGGKVAKYSRGGGIAVKGLGKGRMC